LKNRAITTATAVAIAATAAAAAAIATGQHVNQVGRGGWVRGPGFRVKCAWWPSFARHKKCPSESLTHFSQSRVLSPENRSAWPSHRDRTIDAAAASAIAPAIQLSPKRRKSRSYWMIIQGCPINSSDSIKGNV
jgi:hypothetical protein